MKKTNSSKNNAVNAETPKKKAASKTAKPLPFPIVGIGASAGGLEALEKFLRNMPQERGVALVVVQHLDPTRKGIMTELLQRVTPMKVYQVRDRMRVKPGCVYVIPPNKNLSVLHGVLHLFDPDAPRGLRLPIDYFLRSLAEDRKERSIAVILSGMGSDGTQGLRSVKEKGGLVLVQDPSSAKFEGMPRSAVDTGLVDIVAPVEDLPARITAYLDHPTLAPEPESAQEHVAQSSLEKIVILLREHSGNDFSAYKKNTLYRRIERRMSVNQIDGIGAYVRFLQGNSHERELLFKELLIGVTSFFRDPQAWEAMRDEAIPSVIGRRQPGHVLRAWVPGCSTGEEAFSLAIAFQEAMDGLRSKGKVVMQVFATDLDSDAIEKARKGFYSENIEADVTPERLNRFFIREEGGYRVNKETREMVIFAVQNVISDPPFTKLDFLCCRNLLIYLTAEAQRKLIPLFHYSLNPDAVLFLGNSETIGTFGELFEPLDGKSRIYRRLSSTLPPRQIDFPAAFTAPRTDLYAVPSAAQQPPNLQLLAEQLVLERYSPATVLVSDKGDILFISGRTGKFLEPAAGKANWNIFAMAREGLRYRLNSVFQQALRDQGKSSIHGVEVKNNGGTQEVDVTVEYLNEPETLAGLMLVVFADVQPPPEAKRARGEKSAEGHVLRVSELEAELLQARKEMQLIREETQTSQEELKATNEELQSTNEELQSTNEELATSKEELQSLNEELQTVNAEQTARVEELTRLNSDMKNLLNSTEIVTVFLDNNLHVRRFTIGVDKLFKLRPGDEGRPLTDVVTHLLYEDLAADAREVLRTLVFCEKQVPTHEGCWFRVRIMPYRTLENKIDGLVITFVDITEAKGLEERLRDSETRLTVLIDSAPAAIVCLSPEGEIVEFNREAERIHDRSREKSLGRNYFDLFVSPALREETAGQMLRHQAGEPVGDIETRITVNGAEQVIRWLVNSMRGPDGQVTGVMAIGGEATDDEH
jgi:two-component system CheB/CheR fusion protein